MDSTSDTSAGDSSENGSTVSAKAPGVASDILLRKLLLVDDEVDGAEFAARLLSFHGIEVLVVHSAYEALQALQDNKDIDAVLSDVLMPGMSGIQFAETVRALYPTIKIVLMSGYIIPELLKKSERPYLFAEKPYKIETILELLRT